MPKKEDEPKFEKVEIKKLEEESDLEEVVEETEFHDFMNQSPEVGAPVLSQVETAPQELPSIEEIAQTAPASDDKK